jgi:hypothetical protein
MSKVAATEDMITSQARSFVMSELIITTIATPSGSTVTGRIKITRFGSNQNHPPWWAVM